MAIKKSGTGIPEMTVKFNLNKVSLVLEMYLGVGEISPTPAKIAILLSNRYLLVQNMLLSYPEVDILARPKGQ